MPIKKSIETKIQSTPVKPESNNPMEALLASLSNKTISVHRGEQVEGEIVFIGDKEIIVDLGTKSEGILPLKDFSESQKSSLKVGDKVKAYVIDNENESGQVVLSLNPAKQPVQQRPGGFSPKNSPAWNKLVQSKNQNSLVNGNIVDVNKGGLIVEVDGVRGFIPSSQIGEDTVTALIKNLNADLIGQSVNVAVIEIDQASNRLIFSQKSEKPTANLDSFKDSQKVKGQIIAIMPFGLLIKLEGNIGGLVLNTETAWEKIEDLSNVFKLGQEIEAVVTGKEKELGRLNLSIRKTTEDPFAKISEKFTTDDVISGVVAAVTSVGISFTLSDPSNPLGTSSVEGFMPTAKQEPGITYEIGSKMSLLVDSIDINKRRINVAPFLTTTKGLIYK